MQLESKKILNNRKKYINEIVNSGGQNSKPFKVKKLNKNAKSNNTNNLKMI